MQQALLHSLARSLEAGPAHPAPASPKSEQRWAMRVMMSLPQSPMLKLVHAPAPVLAAQGAGRLALWHLTRRTVRQTVVGNLPDLPAATPHPLHHMGDTTPANQVCATDWVCCQPGVCFVCVCLCACVCTCVCARVCAVNQVCTTDRMCCQPGVFVRLFVCVCVFCALLPRCALLTGCAANQVCAK